MTKGKIFKAIWGIWAGPKAGRRWVWGLWIGIAAYFILAIYQAKTVENVKSYETTFDMSKLPTWPGGIKPQMRSTDPLVIYYFLPTCGHCRKAYPAFLKNVKARNSNSFMLAGYSSTQEEIDDFNTETGNTMPIAIDSGKKFASVWGGSTPRIVVVQPNMELVIHFGEAADSSVIYELKK